MASKSSTSKKSSKKDTPKPIRREVGGAVCLFAAVFTFIGYFKDGYWLIDALSLFVFKGLFGWGFWIVPPVLLAASYVLFFHHGKPVGARLAALFCMPLILGAIVHMIRCGSEYAMQYTRALEYYSTGMALESGGLISSYVSELLRQAVSPYGALPLLIFLFLFCVIIAGRISMKELLTPRPRVAYEPEPEPAPQPVRSKAQPRAEQPALPAIFAAPEKPSRRRSAPQPIDIPLDEPESVAEELPPVYAEPEKPVKNTRRRRKKDEAVEEPAAPAEDIPPMPLGYAAMGKLVAAGAADELLSELSAEAADDTIAPEYPEVVDLLPPLEDEPPAKISKKDVRKATREVAREIEELNEERPETYVYPPLDLLNLGDGGRIDGREEAKLNRERLEATLKSFGIRAGITGITRGPSVTRYDLELEAGLRLTKLTNLAGDLALSLGVSSVRIAPIPGRVATVGVEVPNKLISTVYLREVVASDTFQKAPSTLTFAIGKDISGNCITGNISKLPHMLIAGTTGSGKSVCMNSLILSLLYKSSPDEVRLIMIDPKMVELGIYNGIPHLYIPVVTDPKKAAGSLQWSVVEMMKRYRLFS
ncbi:MAG: DNA translocase FtsK, partial [Ruminococcaceae bacterium]|nr:DNA translocase FtsK [Oscillospiraceae bacterium]